jgi:hypothetical protein
LYGVTTYPVIALPLLAGATHVRVALLIPAAAVGVAGAAGLSAYTYVALPATPKVTQVTVTDAALAREGIEEMTAVFPTIVKQPGAAAPGQGKSVTGVPACCSALVPISTAVGATVLEPVEVTDPPPAIGPIVGTRTMPEGAAGSDPAVVDESVAGSASADDALVTEAAWMSVDVTPDPVTIATTVMSGRVVPWVKDEPLVVHATARPTGVWQTQPVPYEPTGTIPVGTVWVTDIGVVSLAPASTLAVTS